LAVAGVYRLRGRPGYDPPFKVPGYPVVPMLFILSTIALLVNALMDPDIPNRWWTLGVLLTVLAGLPVYHATVGRDNTVTNG
jgi:amino acid transporter